MIAHASPDVRAAWAALSLSLPARHEAAARGAEAVLAQLATDILAVPALDAVSAADRPIEHRRALALDVLMVEAFARRHGALPDARAARALTAACAAVAAALGIQPILNYPLYIRHNPLPPAPLRTFTPLASEARFIRMHRAVEERLDALIPVLDTVLDGHSDDAFDAAFAAAYPTLADGFRAVNALMAAFQDPQRMPVDAFTAGFRPYYASEYDPATGRVLREGPSGLQSPTFRAVAMQLGYADHGLDHWTTHLAGYHETAVRDDLNRRRADRDAGRSMADCFAARFGGQSLPRLHPGHAASLPDLLAMAYRGGWVDQASTARLAAAGVRIDVWPPDAPEPPSTDVPPPPPTTAADAAFAALPSADRGTLSRFAGLEAMLFGFHVAHVATAAAQIGRVPGTGGTSGVDFLVIALFRRAFPALWTSGLGGAAARAGVENTIG